MKVIWTSDEDEILIKFVRSHEVLYNIRHKNYRQTKTKQKLWREVGNTINKTDAECYKRWCYVRDYYIRRKGRIITTGEAAKKRADLLSFIDHFSLSHKNLVEIDQEESTQDNGEPVTYLNQDTSDMTYEDDDSITYNENEDLKVEFDEDGNTDYGQKRKRDSSTEENYHLSKQTLKRLPSLSDMDETDLFFSAMAKIVKKLPRHEQVQMRIRICSLVGDAELRCLPIEESTISSLVKTEYTRCD